MCKGYLVSFILVFGSTTSSFAQWGHPVRPIARDSANLDAKVLLFQPTRLAPPASVSVAVADLLGPALVRVNHSETPLAGSDGPAVPAGATESVDKVVVEGPTLECGLQEGDLLLFKSRSLIMNGLAACTLSVGTTHAAIVVRRCDGTLAILETPNVGSRVQLLEFSRLNAYPGRVWVRHPHRPLTADQSASLTTFAYQQLGKRYDFFGFFAMPMSWPTRRPWSFNASPFDQNRTWYCASIAAGGACAAGLLDPSEVSPRGFCPDDLRRDWLVDLSGSYGPAMEYQP